VGVDFYRTANDLVQLLQRDKDAYHAGFIVWFEPDSQVLQELNRLKMNGYPFVLTDAHPTASDMDYVVTDLVESSRLTVKHFAQSGHKNIAYITGQINRTSLEDRLAGFISGLIACDLPVGEKSVIKLQNTYDQAEKEIGGVLDNLLSASNRPTALYFSHENLAVEAVKHLRAKNFRIPEDISIIGNDISDPSICPDVQLTTVVQDFFEMGKTAAEVLLEKLENRTNPRPWQVSIKPKFIERKSVIKLI
jgi:LacI family transcriptional regulator